MYRIALVLSILIMISCKKEGSQHVQVNTTKATIDSIPVTPVILKDGTLVVTDWVELANFQEELKSVSEHTIATDKNLEQLINLLGRLKETIPEKFNNTTINARIKVLETELLMFNQYVKEQDFKQAAIRKGNLQESYNLVINQIEALLIKEKDYEKYK